jgi:hypothetical protein
MKRKKTENVIIVSNDLYAIFNKKCFKNKSQVIGNCKKTDAPVTFKCLAFTTEKGQYFIIPDVAKGSYEKIK